jgi:hypothetical protein
MNITPFADLKGADLRSADLIGADLSSADLRGVDLRGVDLIGVDLSSADLRGADLRSADLRSADLRSADLRDADLIGADLRGADLEDAILPHFQIPQEGSLIVWGKKNGTLVKMSVPPSARRTATPVGRKCRAEFVFVIEGEAVVSRGDHKTHYIPGKLTYPDAYDADIRVECTHGIHFFLTKEEAEEW